MKEGRRRERHGGNAALERYARHGHRRVDGWLLPAAIAIVRCLGDTQSSLGIGGPIVEIGVHHGRLFLLLQLMTAAGEHSVAYDLFAAQGENVDGSGRGDQEIFERNLRLHGGNSDAVTVRAVNSLSLSADRIVADARGRPRLFSVDGGHTADITENDLRLAQGSICRGGLIVLDDFFNSRWPAVAEGTCRHLAGIGSSLVPVAIGGNKLVFCDDAEAAEAYRGALRRNLLGPWVCVEQAMFAQPVVVVEDDPRSSIRRVIASNAIWRSVRNTAGAEMLRRLVRR